TGARRPAKGRAEIPMARRAGCRAQTREPRAAGCSRRASRFPGPSLRASRTAPSRTAGSRPTSAPATAGRERHGWRRPTRAPPPADPRRPEARLSVVHAYRLTLLSCVRNAVDLERTRVTLGILPDEAR